MAQGMNAEPLYTREILRLAASIPHPARFDELEGSTERRSPTCGSRMRVRVELDGNGRVTELRQAVEACAFGQASAALMALGAHGRDAAEVGTALAGVERWLAGDDEAVSSWPGLEALAPARTRKGRHGAILLPLRTLVAAIVEAEL
jgi:NifU-like protein involved in Fe-S cluster formation